MSDEELAPPASSTGPNAKADPESLVLRARPRPAVRFRRGLIVGITAAFSSAVIALSWFALEPPSLRKAADDGGARDPFGRPSLDALAKAPTTYGDVPRLGPPLPGDLGRPILEQQRETGAAFPSAPAPAMTDAEGRQSLAMEERQRALAALAAARASPVIVQLSDTGARRPSAQSGVSSTEPAAEQTDAADETEGDSVRKAAFAKIRPGKRERRPNPGAPSPWTLSAGTVIPASLVTGLDSDLPGLVIAQVSEPVRDSATGRTVLIPQGARLIGSYDNRVSYGQRRALLVWQRIIFPDASSIDLDKMPATDGAGFAGVADRVSFHTGRLLKGVALSSILGIGSELSLSGNRGLVGALREATQQGTMRAGDQLTQRNLDVQPTIRVRPGWPVRAIVNKDLVLKPWEG